MDTAARVHNELATGPAATEAHTLTTGDKSETFGAELKALYTKWYGGVGLTLADWEARWDALVAHWKEHGAPSKAEPAIAPPKAEPSLVANHPGDPYTSGLGDAPMAQGADYPVGTAAPGTPTSIGTKLDTDTTSIKPKPDATDPTDASLIKTQPVVTDTKQGGATPVPGSPVTEEPLIGTHAPKPNDGTDVL